MKKTIVSLDMSGNGIHNLATPSANTDAANKYYVDQAIANAGVGGGGGGGSFSVQDDNQGNISLLFTAATMSVTDDNNGNVGLIFN